MDLLRFLVYDLKSPVLFICVYRLPFNLFSAHQLDALEKRYEEIRVQDLTPSDTLDMVESLLSAGSIPGELRKFIQKRVEGNPFYVEEATPEAFADGIKRAVKVKDKLKQMGEWGRKKAEWDLTWRDQAGMFANYISAVLEGKMDIRKNTP